MIRALAAAILVAALACSPAAQTAIRKTELGSVTLRSRPVSDFEAARPGTRCRRVDRHAVGERPRSTV